MTAAKMGAIIVARTGYALIAALKRPAEADDALAFYVWPNGHVHCVDEEGVEPPCDMSDDFEVIFADNEVHARDQSAAYREMWSTRLYTFGMNDLRKS